MLLLGALFLSCVAALSSSIFTYSEEKSSDDRFIAVFDAGSTGTRLNIYQFGADGVTLKSHYLDVFRKGLGLMESKEEVAEFLKGMVGSTRGYLLKKRGRGEMDFPIAFNGTGGLRLAGKEKRERLLRWVEDGLGELVEGPLDIRVIDGREEGLYAWAALAFTHAGEGGRVGVIELGGASLQVSFEADGEGSHDLIFGKRKKVFSKSYLGLGLLEALGQIRSGSDACSRDTYDLEGCAALIKHKLSEKIPSPGPEINPSKVYVTSFIAERLKQLKIKSRTTFKEIRERIEEHCRQSNSSRCVELQYILLLLSHFNLAEDKPIVTTNQYNGVDLSWSLGRALTLL